jgi:O-antigen/teichoic acid export membrane protein
MSVKQTTHPHAVHNFAFSGARVALAALSSFVTNLIIARSLGAREMGNYSFMVWVAGTIAGFSSLGLPDSIEKYVAEYRGAGEHVIAAKLARMIVLAQIIASGILLVVAGGIWVFVERSHLALILLALGTVLPTALQQILLGLIAGIQRFSLQFLATLYGSVIQVFIVSIFAGFHASIRGFLIANLLSWLSLTGITLYLCWEMLISRENAITDFAIASVSKRIFAFSITVYVFYILNLIVSDKSELYFLRTFQSPAQIAYYSVAFALTSRLSTVGDSISFVLFPMFVTRHVQEGPDALRAVYNKSMRYIQMLLSPICFWGIPLAPSLVVFAYGKQYAQVAPVAQVLLVTLLVSTTMTTNSGLLYTLDRQVTLLRYMILVALLNLTLDFILIPRHAALGAACANGITQIFFACGLVMLVERELPHSFPFGCTVKILIAALISSLPIFYVDFARKASLWVLFLFVLPATIIYIGLLKIMRVVTTREMQDFVRWFRIRIQLSQHAEDVAFETAEKRNLD